MRSLQQAALAAPVIAGAVVALLFVRGAPGAEAACSSPPYAPKVVTDRPYYYPSQTAQIDGCGFQAYATTSLLLRITRPDSTTQTNKVTIDGSGTFIYYYLLGAQGSYLVEALDASGTMVLASTTFINFEIFRPTATYTPTRTFTSTPTSTFTPIPTSTFTPIPTSTFTPIPTSTFTPTATNIFTSTPTNTFTPTKTSAPPSTPIATCPCLATSSPTAATTPTATPGPVGGTSLDLAALPPERTPSHPSAVFPLAALTAVGVGTASAAIYFARRRFPRAR